LAGGRGVVPSQASFTLIPIPGVARNINSLAIAVSNRIDIFALLIYGMYTKSYSKNIRLVELVKLKLQILDINIVLKILSSFNEARAIRISQK
jgi:hypothetical protein